MFSTSKDQGFLQKQPQRLLDKKVRKLSLSPALRSTPYFTRALVYIAIVIILIGVTRYQPTVFSFIQEPLLDVSMPIFKFFSKPFDYVHQLTSQIEGVQKILADENLFHKLEEEKDYWHAKADTLTRQNKELSQFVHFFSPPMQEGQEVSSPFPEIKKTLRVVARPGGMYSYNLILEGGRRQGIEMGDTILTSQGLVGRITEVGENASRALLITDVETRVPVYLEKSGIQAILAGDSENLPYLLRVQEDPLKPSPEEGERVLTSNLGGGAFPLGIPVGVLEKEESSDVLRVRPFVDLNNLYYVGVVSSLKPLIEEVSLPEEGRASDPE